MNVDGLIAADIEVSPELLAYGYNRNRIGVEEIAMWAAGELASGADGDRLVRLAAAEHLAREDVVDLLGIEGPLAEDAWILADLVTLRTRGYEFDELGLLHADYGYREEMSWCSPWVAPEKPVEEAFDNFLAVLRGRLASS